MGKRTFSLILATMLACGGVVMACGDDDSGGDGTKDGGPGVDTGMTSGGPDSGGKTDAAADSGCTFATYVIGLIDASTNGKAKPDTTLGAGCKDTTSQAEFKPLFP